MRWLLLALLRILFRELARIAIGHLLEVVLGG
jgi:hypothetical protein